MSEARDEGPEGARRPVPARVRALVRQAATASLSTLLARDGSGDPYVSLVGVACDPAATPILLLSDLADHSRNLAVDSRAALLFDGTAGLADPLTGARVALLGHVEGSERAEDRARYLAVNEGARSYAGFGDFHFYVLRIERAHLVAGFGRIHWLDAKELALPGLDPAIFARQAGQRLPQLVERLGRGGLAKLAARAGAPGGRTAVTLAAIDPEGCDLLVDGRRWRQDFERPQVNLSAAEATVLALAEA